MPLSSIRLAPAAAGLVLVAAAPALAGEPFQWELGADFSRRTLDQRVQSFVIVDSDPVFVPDGLNRFKSEDDTLSITGSWFFAPVTSDRGPLERAAFLNRASSVSARYERLEPEFGSDEDLLGVGVRYQLNDAWFATGTFDRSERDFSSGSFQRTTLGASVGRYLGRDTALAFSVTRIDREFDTTSFSSDIDIDFYALDLEHIGELPGNWQYALDATLTLPEGEFDDALLGAALTLYPSRFLGLGLDVSAAIEDTGDQPRVYGTFGRWFVNEQWSVSARYEWVVNDDDFLSPGEDIDEDTVSIGVRYRF